MLTDKKADREAQEFERQKAFASAIFPYQDAKIFKFKALDKEGKEISGYVRAKTKDAAVKGLLEGNYTVQDVQETSYESEQTLPLIYNPLAIQEAVAIFSRQLLVLYRSGVPLNRAVSILFAQTEEKHLKAALAAMYMDMVKGFSFTKSISRHPHVFPQDYVAMVKAGEKAGELATVLERLADLQEKNLKTFRRVTSALTYPLLIFVFAALVNYAVFKWVLPSFMEVFESMNAQLPLITVMVLSVVKFMKTPWFWVVFLSVVGGIAYFWVTLIKQPAARLWLDRLLLRIPQLGDIIRRVVFIRTFRVFATMVSSGVIISSALKNVANVANNEVYRRCFEIMVKKVERGDNLSECFDKEKALFPLIVRQMIKVGDETGEPEIVLNLLADFYESELELALDTFSSLLEPLIMAVMGVVVGVVILAVFLPLYSLINKLM